MGNEYRHFRRRRKDAKEETQYHGICGNSHREIAVFPSTPGYAEMATREYQEAMGELGWETSESEAVQGDGADRHSSALG